MLIAAPLTPDTIGLIGAAQIAASRPGTSGSQRPGRGSVVDKAAMLAGLGAVTSAATRPTSSPSKTGAWPTAPRDRPALPVPPPVFTPTSAPPCAEVRLAIEHAAAEALNGCWFRGEGGGATRH